MKCPFCGNEETQVKDSRIYNDGVSIKRRRICTNCESRFTTLEEIIKKEVYVIKRDGRKELFDKHKLRTSIELGSGKRLTDSQLNDIINRILNKLDLVVDNEIKSVEIGEMIMCELEKIDKVAFIRFASVYKKFENPEDFNNFIKKLKDNV